MEGKTLPSACTGAQTLELAALLWSVALNHSIAADAVRLSFSFPEEFEALAEPALLSLWCEGVDCELPPGDAPRHRMSRNAFYLASPHRRPVWTKVARKVYVLETWGGYLRRMAKLDCRLEMPAQPQSKKSSIVMPVKPPRRSRGRPSRARPENDCTHETDARSTQ